MKKNIALFLSAFIFFACSKSNNGQAASPTKSDGLMPLSVGNYWQYTKISYDSSGSPLDTSLDEIDITEQIGINGVNFYGEHWASFPNNVGSFFVNLDSNTLEKYDSATSYIFLKRVQTDSQSVAFWADTVSSHCKGHNYLYGFTGTSQVNGYDCLRNIVYVNDCTGTNFERWIYYFKPGLGLVRILHFVLNGGGTFYLRFSDDLKSYHTN